MDVTPLIAKGRQIIQKYAGGIFTISGQKYEGPILLTPEETRLWDIDMCRELSIQDFAPMITRKDDIDIFLLGTGKTMALLPRDLKIALKEHGISVDAMDTGAACRTYNVLMAEGRRIMIALLPV